VIPLTKFDGGRCSFSDGDFDFVMIVDVLRYAGDPAAALHECRRVSCAQIFT
jgi:ubiquinone/menaquinone biosynthesis C-methylase UbiE